ncbi:MAG: hypothetical protein ACRDHF_08710 [Tepidiformaceae bacterium]
MVNPVLTVLFNLFLVGSALTIIAAMVQEYLASRTPSVGGGRGTYSDAKPPGDPSVQAPSRRPLGRAA